MNKTKIQPLDCVVIGASAAGISAALYLSRQLLHFKIITGNIGGEMVTAGTIENYPGIPETDGVSLTQKFQEQMTLNHIVPETDVYVQKITRKNSHFVVTFVRDKKTHEYHSKTVIIATGARPRRLDLPGVKSLENHGISYCTLCDGPLFRNKTVAVIGGGNSAMEAALFLENVAKKVYLVTINPTLVGHAYLIKGIQGSPRVAVVPNAQTTKFIGTTKLEGIEYRDAKTKQKSQLAVDGAFVHIGYIPNTDFIPWVNKTELGNIIVDYVGQTSVPGIFAAGDVTQTPFKQIAISTGQGVSAALQVISYLQQKA